eukprot:TRINITY_DN3476_c0_g1_i10.p1 TRINITY_DN3476_c0_g1~~TRINITY_DN3476_c0_g1_i10.p1  ORF type:complete len:288 (-),score=52.03 TRINITY_DN3476_c0_g1_i10:56-919(-)
MDISELFAMSHTYEEFRNTCESILRMNEKQLLDCLCYRTDPEKVKTMFRDFLKTMTEDSFESTKLTIIKAIHKKRGNDYYAQEKFKEAIEEYKKGIAWALLVEPCEKSSDYEDDERSKKSKDEILFRCYLAKAYAMNKQHNEGIAECKQVLKEEPYNITAIYTIALIYKMLHCREKASEYLKRVIVRRTTNKPLVALYKELVIPQPENFPEIIFSCIKDNKRKQVKRYLKKEGFVLYELQIDDFFLLNPLNVESVEKLIEKFARKRRLHNFVAVSYTHLTLPTICSV